MVSREQNSDEGEVSGGGGGGGLKASCGERVER